MKNLGKVGLTVLALGTAYGLGILSCVVYEVKTFCEIYKELKEEKTSNQE